MQALDAPAGWQRVPAVRGEAYASGSGDDRVELAFFPIEQADGRDLARWLDAGVAGDAAGFAARPSCRPARGVAGGGLQVGCTATDADGRTLHLSYATLQAPQGQRRMVRILATSAQAMGGERAVAMAALLRAGLAELARPGGALPLAEAASATSSQSAPSPASPGTGRAPAPAGTAAVKLVAMVNSYRMTGVGGMMVHQFDPIVLYADGRARGGGASPDDDGGGERQVRRGRWQLDGAKLSIAWDDGKRTDTGKWTRCRPAEPGYRLQGHYETLSGGGDTALGGSTSVAVATGYRFDGRGGYLLGKTVGSRTELGDSSTVAASRGAGQGRYELAGYTIRLLPAGGAPRSLLFCRYPDSEYAIFIGRSTYLRDRRER